MKCLDFHGIAQEPLPNNNEPRPLFDRQNFELTHNKEKILAAAKCVENVVNRFGHELKFLSVRYETSTNR